MIDLSALESAARAATPGPWDRCGIPNRKGFHFGVNSSAGAVAIGLGASSSDACCNRDYIAAASPDVVAALARIARAAVQWYNSDDAYIDTLPAALRDAGLL